MFIYFRHSFLIFFFLFSSSVFAGGGDPNCPYYKGGETNLSDASQRILASLDADDERIKKSRKGKRKQQGSY